MCLLLYELDEKIDTTLYGKYEAKARSGLA